MIENNNQKEKRKVHARNYHQLQLEKVEKQKEAKRKALAKLTNKMKEEGNDNGETLFKR
jgi:hypothetical protein